MRRLPGKWALLAVLFVVLVAADQWTKFLAVERLTRVFERTPTLSLSGRVRAFYTYQHLEPLATEPYYVWRPVWRMNYVENPGAAWGLGVGLGVLCVMGIYWLFSSIGTGITPTSATRKEHTLVTKGPYRWIRHPLYTVGSSLFVAFGMMADNWFIAVLGVLAFIVMAIRIPKEEANLIAKFGDEYREYMKRTGRFLPKLRA